MSSQQERDSQQEPQQQDAWSRHQRLITNYTKFYAGGVGSAPYQGSDKLAKTELDILHENHRFLRTDEDDQDLTWEKRVAKKYYDKLFKEYALIELKYFKEGRIAMRWRTGKEVMRGIGQFTCGSLRCDESTNLKSWEVNFAYVEQEEKKNALVKIRLCEECSFKLNWKKAHTLAKSDRTTEKANKNSHKDRLSSRDRDGKRYPAEDVDPEDRSKSERESQKDRKRRTSNEEVEADRNARGSKSRRSSKDVEGSTYKRRQDDDDSSKRIRSKTRSEEHGQEVLCTGRGNDREKDTLKSKSSKGDEGRKEDFERLFTGLFD